jgi:hypothetical protein
MRPVFSSTKDAAGFALLLLVILLSPLWMQGRLVPPRIEAYYAAGPQAARDFSWVRNQVFADKTDLDIAFMGSSHIEEDIDTPYIQAELSERLGRPAVVRTIGWGGAGYDMLYFVARDLLAHRKVRMMVFYDEDAGTDRHKQRPGFFRFAQDSELLRGLPLREQASFYLCNIIGMPRDLICALHPDIPESAPVSPEDVWQPHADKPSLSSQLGALSFSKGYTADQEAYAPFIAFSPVTDAKASEVLVYPPDRSGFEFSSDPLPVWEAVFAQRFFSLLTEYHVTPVMVHFPVLAEARLPVIRERADWPEFFKGDVHLVGIPPGEMFAGLSDEDVKKLFSDPSHLNRNGQQYLTRLLAPALIQLYEESSSAH